MKTKITVNTLEEINIRHGYGSKIEVELTVDIDDVIDAIGLEEVLDTIGKQKCVDHFLIEEVRD